VHAFFSGGEAITFVQQYAQFGLAGEIPLYGPGFLTDTTVLGAQGAAAEGVQTALHYAPALENPVNAEFSAAYEEAYDEPPTQYAVAAYDAAQLLDAALAEFEGAIADDPEGFVAAMEGVGEIDSPRGPFTLSDTHNPEQPFYLLEVQPGEGGELENAVLEELGTVEDPTGG
jgi:branched-chain amino acid transport system substrate-binding protein